MRKSCFKCLVFIVLMQFAIWIILTIYLGNQLQIQSSKLIEETYKSEDNSRNVKKHSMPANVIRNRMIKQDYSQNVQKLSIPANNIRNRMTYDQYSQSVKEVSMSAYNTQNRMTNTKTNSNVQNEITLSLTEKIKSIATSLFRAKQHVRGSKTCDFLRKAIETMNVLLSDLNINPTKLYERQIYSPITVCPEEYMGTRYGVPFFYEGFITKKCLHDKPLSELVTIIKYFTFHTNNTETNDIDIYRFLQSLNEIGNNYSTILVLDMEQVSYAIKGIFHNISVVNSNDKTLGGVINSIVDTVQTPYLLIARDVDFLTHDMRLERLIREIEQLKVPVAGGSFRNRKGHWKKGCYQTVFRNYILKYVEGYDTSLHECLFCDFVQGPFITTREYLHSFKFKHLDERDGVFEEWFLRTSQSDRESIVCPDSMFYIHRKDDPIINWYKLMTMWNIFKVNTQNGNIILRKCSSFKYNSVPSKVRHICSLQYSTEAVKFIMNICDMEGIICELQEGTALGAIKLGSTLPWDRDIDLTFLTANYSAFTKLKQRFTKYGFAFTDYGKLWCCVDNTTAGGQFLLRYKGWNIEMYGQHKMDSQLLIENEINPTKVIIDGQWINVPRNPGLFVRNRYGREVYQHAEHWMVSGDKDGWITYNTSQFQPCTRKGDHDCLDRYNADGNLQMQYILP